MLHAIAYACGHRNIQEFGYLREPCAKHHSAYNVTLRLLDIRPGSPDSKYEFCHQQKVVIIPINSFRKSGCHSW